MLTPREKSRLIAAITALADEQHGRVSRRQLLELGAKPSWIGRRTQEGWLRRDLRGVYGVGHLPTSRQSRWMSAVLSVPGAVLSFRSAGHHLRLLTWSWRIAEVTTAGAGESRPHVLVHHARVPTTTVDGIPVTTPEQTVLDLMTVLDRRDCERVLDNAVAKGVLTSAELRALPARRPRHRGAAKLRQLLACHSAGSTRTQTRLEEDFVSFCRRFGVPLPTMQYEFELPLGKVVFDGFYEAERVAVELDGPHHDDPVRAARDRRRDMEALTLGVPTVRLRPDDLTRNTAAELRALLRSRGFRPPLGR